MVKGIDYKKVALQKRNLQKEFHGNRLWSAHVVGKAVELALRKSYRPAVGALPVPVHAMGVLVTPGVSSLQDRSRWSDHSGHFWHFASSAALGPVGPFSI